MLLRRLRELPRLILAAHFDVYGIFLAVAYQFNPSDRQLNHYRALASVCAVDSAFVMNVAFSANELMPLEWLLVGRRGTIMIVVSSFGIALANTLALATRANRYRLGSKVGPPVPRAEGVSRWVALGYMGLQIPWLLINSAWHLG